MDIFANNLLITVCNTHQYMIIASLVLVYKHLQHFHSVFKLTVYELRNLALKFALFGFVVEAIISIRPFWCPLTVANIL